MIVSTDSIPIGAIGLDLNICDFDDGEDDLIGLLPDDRLVVIVGADEVSSFQRVSTVWYFDADKTIKMPNGLYQLMRGFWPAYKVELESRRSAKRKTARFEKSAPFIGFRFLSDFESATELIDKGWAKILSEV